MLGESHEGERISRRDLLRGRFPASQKPVGQKPAGQKLGGQPGLLRHDGNALSTHFGSADSRNAAPSLRYSKSFPVLRPPGAIEEEAFLDGCTRCDACIETCPHDAIMHAPPRFRRAAGTPMIDPVRSPCRMCDDFPCIVACEPDVLRLAMPKQMGVARVDLTTCLAHNGSFCTVCAEHCPVDGAIELRHGKPFVIESTCTGCGVCQHVCPAPANAILLMPTATRPTPPAIAGPAPAVDASPLQPPPENQSG